MYVQYVGWGGKLLCREVMPARRREFSLAYRFLTLAKVDCLRAPLASPLVSPLVFSWPYALLPSHFSVTIRPALLSLRFSSLGFHPPSVTPPHRQRAKPPPPTWSRVDSAVLFSTGQWKVKFRGGACPTLFLFLLTQHYFIS